MYTRLRTWVVENIFINHLSVILWSSKYLSNSVVRLSISSGLWIDVIVIHMFGCESSYVSV